MHGVLQFKTTHDEGSFRPYRRRNAKRTKSGCLSCRVRHTKCDGSRPICGGCVRNHLLCAWPNSGKAITTSASAGSGRPTQPQNATSLCCLSPNRALSLWPRLHGRLGEQRLLHHYIERSAKRLVINNVISNPFLAYILPLAEQHDGFLHVVFAISASHLSYEDQPSRSVALSHYGVALRAVKYLITDHGSGYRRNSLLIVILLLALCNFEVIDGNTNGAVMQHLLPCCALLTSQNDLLETVNKDCACFIAEQYMFLSNVNSHIGFGPIEENRSRPTENQALDLSPLSYRAYYRGRCSGCAYALFEMIPQIAAYAEKPAMSSPRHLDPDIITEFHSLEQHVLLWVVPEPWDGAAPPDSGEIAAAIFQQMALLIALHCALHGPGVPSPPILGQITYCLSEARRILKTISPSSGAWATLLWPLLHIGSCITIWEEQKDYIATFMAMENKMPVCTSTVSVLYKLWDAIRQDGRYYGPYGIREFLAREGIKLSL
ncbi:fungal-specific transcription factor domain-containing protein [Aspergillus bertholletiae]|uniref:Fungal-specific transcription factor domain-containing protein n=1 Tax=Aspergillus bertholletiae TaxID=1226010 RepID=A0A5N7B1S4_9EURO|nr:fungal-specific transcription factor domain-containing protein [Aspergillus bertholletiae]